jgi:GNAT superfamily N-acetyltransferase
MDGFPSLAGAVDGHVHACPHLNARRLDVLQAVDEAQAAGMAGLGLIDNFASSVQLAALARRARPDAALDIFGGIVLEPPAGGLSPEAVAAALAVGYGPGEGARFVSLPTHHTAFVARAEGRDDAHLAACLAIPERGPPPDALLRILDLVAAADVVLNTGHLSAPEAMRVVEEARGRGVARILVPCNAYDPAAVQALTAAGAVAELSFFFVSHATEAALTHVDAQRHVIPRVTAPRMAALARAAAPDRLILSSDCGSSLLPPPVEGLRCFLALLDACDAPRDTLARAVRDTPARLFRIGQRSSLVQ